MRYAWETHVTACKHCGFNQVPTFRHERQVSFREVGEPGTEMYSREMAQILDVMVCLSCGQTHESELLIG